MFLVWFRSHFPYLVLAWLSKLSCATFASMALWARQLEVLSVQTMAAASLAIIYLLPIFVPVLRRLVWIRPRFQIRWLAPAVWWSLPLAVIVIYGAHLRMWSEVVSKNTTIEDRHQTLARLAEFDALMFGANGGRAVFRMYAFSGNEPLKPPEDQWAWQKFLEWTPHPLRKDDEPGRDALLRLGQVCERGRRFHQSQEYFRQLLALLELWTPQELAQLPDSGASIMQEKRTALRGVSTSLIQQGEYAQAAALLEPALEISKKHRPDHDVLVESAELADLYIQLENYKAAEPLAATALQLSGQSASLGLKDSSGYVRGDAWQTYAAACLRLSKVLNATGRPELAAEYGRMAKTFADNTYSSASVSR